MNTISSVEPDTETDSALVERSLDGDRDAFGRIVARYQSPLCALAYSACGNFARSEDLAQEVFITAWRKLDSLQEPARLRAWLFGIARNLIANAFRQHQRNPLAAADELETADPVSPSNEPDAQVISKEEETILWHVLSGLPETYREPMVLFYRENESISRVAELLGISEEAVRQRLSRGRGLLNERVAGVVRNGLRRSRPSRTFTLAVLGALPALAATTTANGASVGMTTAKSASQASGWSLFKGIGFFAGLVAIPAALGSVFGFMLGRDSTGIAPSRASVAQFWRVFIGGLVVFLLCPLLVTFGVTAFLQESMREPILTVMTIWLGLAYPFVIGTLLFWRWQRWQAQRHFKGIVPFEDDTAAETGTSRSKSTYRRLIPALAIVAAALLVFCYFDMRHEVVRLTAEELRNVINQSAPGELTASVSVRHYRSLWGASSETYRTFLIERETDGKTTAYVSPADDATAALLYRKGISCPEYVEGRDFQILGTPGRFLPLLAAFVFAISIVFLLKSR
jgi:RNA polymerase sigma factor (sigma-70 family)